MAATAQDLTGEVCAIVQGELGGAARITAQTRAAEVDAWDSHATVDIIFAIEARFGLQMSSAEMERIEGVADLLSILAAHGWAVEA